MSAPSSKTSPKTSPDEQRFEIWLSWLLRGGTYLALALLLSGLVVNFFTGQSWIAATDLTSLLSGEKSLRAAPPATVAEFFYGFRILQGLNFVQAALIVLIALPGLRVAFLLGNFIRRRDLYFAVFSVIVLIALSVGFIFRLEL